MIQGFLLKHKKKSEKIMDRVEDILQSDENIKIDQFLIENVRTASTISRLKSAIL